MSFVRNIVAGLRSLFRKEQVDQELDDELRTYLEMAIDEKMQQGMSREEAARAVRLERGSFEVTKEIVHAAGWESVLETCWQDLRYALRMFRKRPAFTLVAVLALGVGIGSNTAIFSLVDAVLLRGLSVEHVDRLVMVWQQDLKSGRDRITFSPAEYADYQSRSRSFEGMAAIQPVSINVTLGDRPEAVAAARCSFGLLSTLGVKPFLGRTFIEDEDWARRDRIALLSYGFWTSHFGADPKVLGKTFPLRQGFAATTSSGDQTVDGSFTIVGILPRDLDVPYVSADIFIPLYLDYDHLTRTEGGLRVFALLKRGVSVDQASSDVDIIARDLSIRFPERSRNVTAWLVPLRVEDVGDIEPTLVTLTAAVGLLLLIVCTNVANMLLARALERRKEIAVRLALGVKRGRLVRQLLTESLLLGLMGTVVGLLLAIALTYALAVHGPATIPRMQHVTFDGLGLSIAAVTGFLTSMLFGIIPALRASRIDLKEALQQKAGDTKSTQRLRQVLVTSQVALAFVVLTGAAVVAKSFFALHVNLGYDPRHLLTFRVSLPQSKYVTPEQRAAFFRQALERVSNLPGTMSAGAVNILPQMDTNRSVMFTIDGRPDEPSGAMNVRFRIATPGYFRAMGTPMLRGREFNEAELETGAVVISASLGREFWPGRDPVGEHIRLTLAGHQTTSLPIVGVAEDMRQWNVSPSQPTIYWSNVSQPSFAFAIRTAGEPMSALNAARHSILTIDTEQPVFDAMTMEQRLGRSQGTTYGEFRTTIMAGFGMAALLLATLGIYGVIHYSVLQRTQEFGIRMALGAVRGDIIRMIVWEAFLIASIGSGVGLMVSLALTRLLATFLYAVSPSQPGIVAAVAVLLVMVAAGAGFIPARRAAGVDPMVALRYE